MLTQSREQNKNDIAENIRIFCWHNELILLGFRAKREISQGRRDRTGAIETSC